MNYLKELENLLKGYKLNKARIGFLEGQLKRLTPELHNEYIEYRMFSPGFSGAAPRFVMEKGEEVSRLNKVEETAEEYRVRCEHEYKGARMEMEKELRELKYYSAIVEDSLETLQRVNSKYSAVIKQYYIESVRMEDVADTLHISRSRCYELCKEAVRWLVRIIYGEGALA